jgi:ADP-ribose pyrophosphatase
MSETPNAALQVSDEPSPRRLLSSETVYEGRIWDVVRDTIQLNDDAGPIVREYIRHPGAVAVLPMNDAGEVLLIKQYRHPIGMDLWEIPAGLLDVEGEDFVAGAARELAEEADLVPLDEAVTAVLDGRLHNPSAVVGLLAAAAARAENFQGLRPASAPWPVHPSQR